MRDISDYLTIPLRYVADLGELRWSASLDAVEHGDGHTFALASELVRFLEGFASRRPLMHLSHALHFMHLLRHGTGDGFARMAKAWRDASWPARTAGVLAAALCQGVPAAPNAPTAKDLGDWLATRTFASAGPGDGIEPSLAPAVFEAHLARALEGWDEARLLHWFRHGQDPLDESGRKLAAELAARKPPSLSDRLAEVSRHERLRGAVPHVARLEGTLSLPPRRLHSPRLQRGGYSDITSKGAPEQLLPSQFALDGLEFLRRWADNELLFFRREEPHRPAAEELVLLIDQGVRTWGAVRLLLAAATFALARQAEGKQTAVRLAATSRQGPPLDPVTTVPEDVAALLAGSDLSPHPGLALEGVLERARGRAVDVVLFTHPRNLNEADVSAAARVARLPSRLFAVTANEAGEIGIHQVLHGVPVTMGRFRLDMNTPAQMPQEGWTGPLEKVGFPFRFGLLGPPATVRFALDGAGRWLVASSRAGIPLFMDLVEETWELLPRVTGIGHLLGIIPVTGGFVMVAPCGAAHYDLATKTVTEIFYSGIFKRGYALLREHALVIESSDQWAIYSLATHTEIAHSEAGGHQDHRIRKEAENVWSEMRMDSAPDGTLHLCLARERGVRMTFILARGQHLNGTRLVSAQMENNIVVVEFANPHNHTHLGVFQVISGEVLFWLSSSHAPFRYALSNDGRRLATHGGGAVEVYDTAQGNKLAATPMGGVHNNLEFELGHDWLAIWIGKHVHVARWDLGPLDVVSQQGDPQTIINSVMGLKGVLRIARQAVREERWRTVAKGAIHAKSDHFGNIFLFTKEGAILASFFVFQGQLAAWLPDGTRMGPERILGGPPSLDAAIRIGRALNESGASS